MITKKTTVTYLEVEDGYVPGDDLGDDEGRAGHHQQLGIDPTYHDELVRPAKTQAH